MMRPSPRIPDPTFPPQITQGRVKGVGLVTNITNKIEKEEDDDTDIPVAILTKLIVAALRCLNQHQGSTIMDVRRLLASEKVIGEGTDLRQGFILGLKRGVIQRPRDAVDAAIYGLYIAPDGRRKSRVSRARPKRLRPQIMGLLLPRPSRRLR